MAIPAQEMGNREGEMKQTEPIVPAHLQPLEAYHKELKMAGTIRDKKILAAERAFKKVEYKAWKKYKAAGGE